MISVALEGGRIRVAAPFALGFTLRKLPGAKWDDRAGRWTLPATPAGAAAVLEHLGEPARLPALLELAGVLDQAGDVGRAYADPHAEIPPLPFDPPLAPWRHQRAAFHFARPLPAALLYLGMGTGKTAIALWLVRAREHRRTLVVAPLAVLPAWQRQAELHAPELRVVVLDDGSVEQKAKAAREALELRDPRPVVVVVNYESAWRGALGRFALDAGFDLVIADEVHRAKSPGSEVSTYLAKLGTRVPYRLALSGTPLAHSPMDAYGVFRFLDPAIFGTSYVRFRAKYAVLGGFQGRQVVDYQNREEFARRFYSITFQAGREVLELPESTHVERTFRLPPPAAAVYRALRDEFVAEVDGGIVTAANALPRLLRLQQVTSGFVTLDGAEPAGAVSVLHTEKRYHLEEVLADLPPDEPVVVFCRFRRDLDAVHQAAKADGRQSLELSGARHELAEWQAGAATVLAVQIQSGSEGVDLTRARVAVFYSLGFSLAQYEQALARTHRPGQSRPVLFVHVIADGTVDRTVYRALRERREVIDAVLAERKTL